MVLHYRPFGKRSLWALDITLPLVMALLGLLAALIAPRSLNDPFSLFVVCGYSTIVGFLLFLAAKLSLFYKRIWFSWGTSQMSTTFSTLYKGGYLLMVLGLLPWLLMLGL